MMCCVGEIAMLVFGIIALATGKFTLTRNKVVRGASAQLVGVILVLPLPLGLVASLVLGGGVVASALQKGEKQVDPEELKQLERTVNFIHAALILGCLVGAIVVAAATAQPPAPKRRPRRQDDYEEDDFDNRRGGEVVRRPRQPPDERFMADDKEPRRPRRPDDR